MSLVDSIRNEEEYFLFMRPHSTQGPILSLFFCYIIIDYCLSVVYETVFKWGFCFKVLNAYDRLPLD